MTLTIKDAQHPIMLKLHRNTLITKTLLVNLESKNQNNQ
jgi:hypothetical protein